MSFSEKVQLPFFYNAEYIVLTQSVSRALLQVSLIAIQCWLSSKSTLRVCSRFHSQVLFFIYGNKYLETKCTSLKTVGIKNKFICESELTKDFSQSFSKTLLKELLTFKVIVNLQN